MPDHDIVQCEVLVNKIYGILSLIMNEYAYSGQGHSDRISPEIGLSLPI